MKERAAETPMQMEIRVVEPALVKTSLLVAFAFDAGDGSPELMHRDQAPAAALKPMLDSGEFKAAPHETLLLHAPAGLQAERLLVVGSGKRNRFTWQRLSEAAGTAVRFAMQRDFREVALLFPSLPPDQESAAARALAEGALLGAYDTDVYKSERKKRTLDAVRLILNENREGAALGFREGIELATAQNFARSLTIEPGNVLTPTELGRRALAMAAECGLAAEVHSTDKLQELGMGAFLAVARGSAQPPTLIVLRYEPAEAQEEGAPLIALVGKGITFDTGGISIKPADGMEKMKYDMAGAAAMLGAMYGIALLKPRVRVMCVVCSAENMPDGAAYRPGDVLTAMSGKTIEVMNTDAEGRLVLADGLHYAKTLGATHLVDAATLTGAVAIALGRLNAGVFSNDEPAFNSFLNAARRAGEHFWRLPCTDDYAELIKSSIADIQNTGVDRYGGAITAAMFLKEFVGDTPWLHLDIAGTSWIDDQRTYLAKGPSGMAVRSIVEWVRGFDATQDFSATSGEHA